MLSTGEEGLAFHHPHRVSGFVNEHVERTEMDSRLKGRALIYWDMNREVSDILLEAQALIEKWRK